MDEIEKYLTEYEEKISRGEYPKNHKRYVVTSFKNKDEFIGDIQKDINLFDEILTRLSELDLVRNDPKSACLLKNLRSDLIKNQ